MCESERVCVCVQGRVFCLGESLGDLRQDAEARLYFLLVIEVIRTREGELTPTPPRTILLSLRGVILEGEGNPQAFVMYTCRHLDSPSLSWGE